MKTKQFLGLLAVTIGLGSCNGGSGNGRETYQEKVQSVADVERSDPPRFLEASGTYNDNFWGNKIKVHCTIKNKATAVTYKDPIVQITYYSKTKTVLGSITQTIYEFFPPNSEKTIEMKIDNYQDVDAIGWNVTSAVPQ